MLKDVSQLSGHVLVPQTDVSEAALAAWSEILNSAAATCNGFSQTIKELGTDELFHVITLASGLAIAFPQTANSPDYDFASILDFISEQPCPGELRGKMFVTQCWFQLPK